MKTAAPLTSSKREKREKKEETFPVTNSGQEKENEREEEKERELKGKKKFLGSISPGKRLKGKERERVARR